MAAKRGEGKNKQYLLNRLKDMYGEDFHPIMSMAANAVKLQEIAELEADAAVYKNALDGWEKIAQYIAPKLKAVELTGEGGDPIETRSLFEFIPVSSKSE